MDGCKASTAISIKGNIMSRGGVECANMWWGKCHLNLMIALMVMMINCLYWMVMMMMFVLDGDGDLCVTRSLDKAPHVIWLPSGSTVAAVRHHTYIIKNHVWTFLSVFS